MRDKSSYTPSDDDDDDGSDSGCSFLQALLFGCPSDDGAEARTYRSGGPSSYSSRRRRGAALRSNKFFLSYPYAYGRPGNVVRLRLPYSRLEPEGCDWDAEVCDPEAQVVTCVDGQCYQQLPGEPTDLPAAAMDLRSARLQLFADLGQDLDGLTRATLGLSLSTNDWFALESRWTYWAEQLQDGAVDGLWMGDVNLHVQLLTLPAVQWSAGAGPRALVDPGGGTAGANLTTKFELYPVAPLTLRLEGDIGNLGTAFVWEARSSVGVLWERLEFYGGYDVLRVADVPFDSWCVGLRSHL